MAAWRVTKQRKEREEKSANTLRKATAQLMRTQCSIRNIGASINAEECQAFSIVVRQYFSPQICMILKAYMQSAYQGGKWKKNFAGTNC
jgi:hypothetical protein